jgi:FAD:protein FMN transferase
MSALHRTQWRAVGTTCAAAVTAGSHDESEARRALDAAQDEVAACERELSRFDPTSDLSRLNAAGGRWTPIGRRLLEALDLALRAREETGGRFDPTVLPALAASGYDRSFELLEEREARWADDWRAGTAIELDPRNGRGRLERGTSVDLGGIGKGYAAGRAVDAMVAASPTIAGGLVDLGGDIAVRGESPEGGPWLVAIADPRRAGETLAVLALDSGGVATSGRDARRFGPARSLHHLIDPETGESALAGPLTVTVVAPDPVAAEVHATTLAIAGPGEAEEHVSARPRISALYVPHAGPAIPLGSLPLVSERLVVSAA